MPSLLMPPKVKQSLLLQQKPKIRKLKLLRSNPARLSYLLNGDDFGYLIDDEDILSGYSINNNVRRVPRDEDTDDNDDELSDHVKFRLWLARQLALKKYHEKWG